MQGNFLLIIFWMSVFGILYPLTLYPALLCSQALVAGILRRREQRVYAGPLPAFTVIVPAHNEEIVIGQKLENLIECIDRDELDAEIIVVSDGSTDRTCEIVASFRPKVRLIETRTRGGVLNALRTGASASRTEIVVFSDADVRLDPHVYLRMIPHFLNPTVGGVCGSTGMEIRKSSGLGGERLNVVLRRWIRLMQSKVHSSIGADGSNWSMRKSLLRFPESGQIAEDLVMPMEVVRLGYRYVYEPRALAWEVSPSGIGVEFERKIRTIAGGLQAAWHCRWMFRPKHLNVAFHYVSWKLLKYAIGMWVILAFMATCFLALDRPAFRIPLALGSASLIVSLVGGFGRAIAPSKCPRVLSLAWYAFLTALMPFLAIHRLATRRATVLWQMAPRTEIGLNDPLRGIHSRPISASGRSTEEACS